MGPFPCGDWPDIVCFRYALKQMLDDEERVEADAAASAPTETATNKVDR